MKAYSSMVLKSDNACMRCNPIFFNVCILMPVWRGSHPRLVADQCLFSASKLKNPSLYKLCVLKREGGLFLFDLEQAERWTNELWVLGAIQKLEDKKKEKDIGKVMKYFPSNLWSDGRSYRTEMRSRLWRDFSSDVYRGFMLGILHCLSEDFLS